MKRIIYRYCKKYDKYAEIEKQQKNLDIFDLLHEHMETLIYRAKDGEYYLKGAALPLNIIVSVTGPTKDGTKTEIINAGYALQRKLSTLITEFRKRTK